MHEFQALVNKWFTQINDNGVISFNSSFNVRTPLSLPLNESDQIIAPYWADVDTRGSGDIFYRQSTDPDLLARASREIKTALSLTQDIKIKHLLIATWDAVGYYYRNTDKVHTLYVLIIIAFCNIRMYIRTYILLLNHMNYIFTSKQLPTHNIYWYHQSTDPSPLA